MAQRDEKGRFVKGECPNPAGRGGKRDAADLFKNASVRAVRILIKAMDDEELTANGRLEAAREILNRVYGKATQFGDEDNDDNVIVVRMDERTEEYAK